MPIISVIMSVYKEPIEWICQSIDSILNQTFSDFEFIIICDNPGYEEGKKLLSDYAQKDRRIRLIFNEENVGLTKSLNKGLDEARGKYIARMDADDISKRDRFKKQVALLETNCHITVCGSCIELFGARNAIVTFPEKKEEMYLFLSSPFAHPAVMIRKESLKELKYDENYTVSQDYALWVAMDKNDRGHFYNIQECLLKYRVSSSQLSALGEKNAIQKKMSCQIRREAFNTYCKRHNLKNYIGFKEISYKTINEVKKSVVLPADIKQILIYYLYCSVEKNIFSKIYNMIFSFDLFRLRPEYSLRIIKYSLFSVDFKMF